MVYPLNNSCPDLPGKKIEKLEGNFKMRNFQNIILGLLLSLMLGGCVFWSSSEPHAENQSSETHTKQSKPSGQPVKKTQPEKVVLELSNNEVVIDVKPFTLSGGLPSGGAYSGNGVDNNVFFPEKAGVGSHQITYTFKGKSAFGTITVLPPKVSLYLPRKSVYIGFPPFDLSGGEPSGGKYSGKGVKNNRFYPQEAGGGNHEITYTYFGFSAQDSIVVNGPKERRVNYNCPRCHGTDRVSCDPNVTCTRCFGDGRLWDRKCSECDGTGRVRTAWKMWMGKRDCPECKGSGNIYKKCSSCKGTGKEKCPKCKGTGYAPCPLCN